MLTSCGTRPLETERLLLRRFRPDDWQDVLANWAADPAVQLPYSELVKATREEVCGLLEKYITASDDPGYYRWAVIEKASSQCIGQIAFFLVNSTHRFAEIGYCIGRRFQRRGYATEAARESSGTALPASVFTGFRYVTKPAMTPPGALFSAAAAHTKVPCGTISSSTAVDRLYYSILRPEWEARQQSAQASAARRVS